MERINMEKKFFLIISNKFAPGHFSHMKALYQLIHELQQEAYLLIDKKYSTFIKDDINVNYIDMDHLFIYDKVDMIIFQNPSTENHVIAKKMKNKYGCKIIYIFHEPITKMKDYLIGNHKLKKWIKIKAIHHYNNLMLKTSDYVILPSNAAKNIYLNNKSIIKRPYSVIPLLFDDECLNIDTMNKKYFSYIGTVANDHGFDQFILFIKYCLQKDILISFQIASPSVIDDYLDESLKQAISSGKLLIKTGKVLSNDEINEAYSNSFLIWNGYYRSTQSGVLPKAFMFGTPVIATKVGSFTEFIENQKNGYLIQSNHDYDLILKYALNAKLNIELLSKNCRQSFIDKFYYKSNLDNVNEIINTL